MEYIFDSHVKASNSEEAASKRVLDNEKKQIILKQEREIAGEVQKKLFPNPKMNNYSDLSLNFSYFFEL